MHITLRQLRIFEAVANHLSISRAAADLHLTQPAVSMQMKQLEEQLGVALIEQVGRRMTLTDAGREVRGHARDIAKHMAELGLAMEQFRNVQRGVLRLAVVSTANYFLAPVVAEFHRRYPSVRLMLKVANRETVLAQLADNSTDLAITGQPPDSLDLVAQHFMENPLVVIAPPSHPLAAESHVSLQRLAAETLVVREPGSGTRAATERHFTEYGQTCRAGCQLSTNEALKQAVRAGLGLGVVSAQTIELELQTGCLVVLPVENFPIVRRLFVAHRTHKRLSAAALTFRQLLLALDPNPPVHELKPARARKRQPHAEPD